ncbi:hypothetical protein Cni_G14045 [Canna indica]|uniref:Homeobox domain-containing protein n=1 Tax=Canna indica TaxID=4628 RepID=A0AAQ3KB27_9LILI|nr:hypothetical protein Cni_G14045 [Canna indica]
MAQEMTSAGRANAIGTAAAGEETGRRADAGGQGEGVLRVQVMTDEQVEVLRRQIAAYATICEQLVEMHRAFTAQQDSLAGMRLGSIYSDSMVASGGHRITPRQRWSPTSKQLQMLENIFDQGNGTPSKKKIREITLELSQHGQISETNVYNWFQNRRARSKRKQMAQSNTEFEAEADGEFPNEKKPKPEKFNHEALLVKMDSHGIYNAQVVMDKVLLCQSSESSRSSGISGEMYYDNFLPNQNHMMEKMEIPGSFSTLQTGKSYGMIG